MTTSTTIPTDDTEQAFEPVPFRVVGNNIIIEFGEQPKETVTAGGLVIPSQAKPETRKSIATVVGAGPEAAVVAMQTAADGEPFSDEDGIDVGMVLVVHRHRLTKLELEEDGDRQLWVIDPSSVIAIVD